MNTREWVAIHRKHHATVDTEEDPHTPIFYNLSSTWRKLKWVFFIGVSKYVKESHNKETIEKWGHGTPNDWMEKNIYTPHNYLGAGFLLGILNVFFFGLPGLLVWMIQGYWIPVFAAGIINGFGHWFGYINYKQDAEHTNIAKSKNLCKIGILIGGEELHNNHHAFPASPKLAHKSGEFDVGWEYIRFLSFLRLAKVDMSKLPK